MKISKILLFTFVFFTIDYSFSQEVDSIYGLNPILYNGQLYTYYVPKSVTGDQYLHDEDFKIGSVTIGNAHFDSVLLNYDIYNQEIVLSFKLNQHLYLIKLFKDRINNFLIGKEYFELISEDQSGYAIYQVIGNGNYEILYHWQKWLKVSSDSQTATHSFTKPLRTMYLKINDQIKRYKNNRSFLSLLEDSKKQQVKTFLRQNKINVKKASDNELYKLIELCNSL